MRLSLTRATCIVLQVLAQVAARGTKKRPLKAPRAAALVGVPLPSVRRWMTNLGRAGIVKTSKGLNGGYHLLRAPGHISLLEVILAVDGPAVSDTPDGAPSGLVGAAAQALEAASNALRDITLEDVLERVVVDV